MPAPGVTLEDAPAIAATLPRSYQAVVRGSVRFRVGRIVYAAFPDDESRYCTLCAADMEMADDCDTISSS